MAFGGDGIAHGESGSLEVESPVRVGWKDSDFAIGDEAEVSQQRRTSIRSLHMLGGRYSHRSSQKPVRCRSPPFQGASQT